MAGYLSPHLSVAEYLATAHRDLVPLQWSTWDASPDLRASGARFAAAGFEPTRTLLGVPLHVTSGYRCGALNAAVRGRPTSRHVLALAADVVPVGLDLHAACRIVWGAIRAGTLALDEAIEEMGWLHIQLAPAGEPPRRLALRTVDGIHFEGVA